MHQRFRTRRRVYGTRTRILGGAREPLVFGQRHGQLRERALERSTLPIEAYTFDRLPGRQHEHCAASRNERRQHFGDTAPPFAARGELPVRQQIESACPHRPHTLRRRNAETQREPLHSYTPRTASPNATAVAGSCSRSVSSGPATWPSSVHSNGNTMQPSTSPMSASVIETPSRRSISPPTNPAESGAPSLRSRSASA